MKRLGLFIIALGLFSLTSCGTNVEVPPAHVGKLSTKSGLSEKIIPSSKLRLTDMCMQCDSLIMISVADTAVKETIKTFMPKDKLNLSVDVRGMMSIKIDEVTLNRLFTNLPAQVHGDPLKRTRLIGFKQIYNTYVQPVLREEIRTIVTKYTIMDVMENREAISNEIFNSITAKLHDTPVIVKRLGLADLQPPVIIVQAQEATKKRQVEIEKAEAEKQVMLKHKEAEYEVAKKQQQIDLKEAQTQALVNTKLGEGVSEAFIKQRALKVLMAMAESENKVIFLPTEAFNNPSILLGGMLEASK